MRLFHWGSTLNYTTVGGNAKMYGGASCLEVIKPTRPSYTQQFCDEAEKTSRQPMTPTWPETMLITATFAVEGSDCKRITVQREAYGTCTREELQTFINA